MAQPLWRIVWKFLKKTKVELPYYPEVPFLATYPEKTVIQKDTCIPVFIVALFTISKERTCPSTDEDEEDIYKRGIYIYTHTHRDTQIIHTYKGNIVLCAYSAMK